MDKPFEHVVIVGCGLLGASLGLALRKHALAKIITGVGRAGSPSVNVARKRGAIDRTTDDVALAVGGGTLDGVAAGSADLVVVCAPVRQFPALFRTMCSRLAPGTLVTDVGSTKSQVMTWAAELLPANVAFVGSHPMAGSEKTGPEAAREDLYNGAVCLVCPPTHNPPESAAVTRISNLWKQIGMRVISCNAADHDRWVAAVSHMPHALAFSLVNAAGSDPRALEAAAGGYIDMTRIASSDATMWTDILLTNRDAVLAAIDSFSGQLGTLKAAVAAGDETAIRNFLTSAKATRDAFIERRRAARGT